MITKKLFKTCIESYQKYREYEDKLASLDINIFERDEIQDVMLSLLSLLEYCSNDISMDNRYPTDIEYFCFDSDFGRLADTYFITEADGTEVKIHNVDELWEYLVQQHPEIEDKETMELI